MRAAALLVLLGATLGRCSGSGAPQLGLLERTLQLVGWREAQPPSSSPTPNDTAVLSAQFRDSLMESVAERLEAIRARQPLDRRQHHRQKRDHPVSLPLTRDPHGVRVLLGNNGVVPVWELQAPGARHLHLFSDDERVYALAAFGAGSRTSWLYELVGDSWVARGNFSSFGTLRFTTFWRRGEGGSGTTRFLVGAEYDCVYNRPDKRGPVLSAFNHGVIEFQHVLPVIYPTDVAIWSDYGTMHIGVASELEVRPDGTRNYHVNSSIFKWTDGNFQQHSLPTYGARDIEHFQIQNHFFVMIANHQNNDGSLNIYSEILRYSLGSGLYQPYQRLLTYGAVRSRHFTFGNGVGAEHFLVVANQADREPGDAEPNYRVNSVVFKFSRSQFVPFQCLPTVRAHDVLPVWGPRGEFVLALTDAEGVKLYQYTGWRFALVATVPLPAPPADSDPDQPGAGPGLGAFTYRDHVHLTCYARRDGSVGSQPGICIECLDFAVGSPGGPSRLPTVYRLRFGLRTDVRDLHQRCEQWCQDLTLKLTQLRPRVNQLSTALQTAPRVDQPTDFSSLTVHSNSGSVFRSVAVNNIRLDANVTVNSGLLGRLAELRRRLHAGAAALEGFRQTLATAVSTTSIHHFTHGVTVTGGWSLRSASIGSVTVQYLLGVGDLAAFLDRVVWIGRPYNASAAQLSFRSLTVRDGAGLQVGTLSRLRAETFVTLSGDHVITASKVLRGHVTAGGVVVRGLVNGVLLNATTVIRQGQLPDHVFALDTVAVDNLRVRSINGIDVGGVLGAAVNRTAGVLPGGVRFLGPVLAQSASVTTINGVSVTRLLERALTTAGGQTISGAWAVSTLHLEGALTVQATLNGVRVPGDLVPLSGAAVRLGTVSFQSTTIRQLTVSRRLGLLQVSEGRLPLLLTSGDQYVTGRKTVGALYISGGLSVEGLINGAVISAELLRGVANQTGGVIYGDKVVEGSVTFLADVQLTQLNSLDVLTLLSSALRLNSSALPLLRLQDVLIFGDLRTPVVNDLPVSDWLRRDGVAQVVSGNKALGSLTAPALYVDQLNGLPLDSGFYGAVLRTEGHQQVLGPLLFTAETHFNRLTAATVSWQGYDLSEAVTVRGTHTITGPKLYSRPLQLRAPELQHLTVDGLLDGVNVTELLAAADVNATHTVVNGSQTFGRLVTVTDLTVQLSVDGRDLVSLLTDAVRDGGTVSGDLVFDGNVTADRLKFDGTLDGVQSSDFGSAWLTSAGGQTLSGAVTSSSDVTVAALEVTAGAAVNGAEGSQLLAGLVKLAPGAVIDADVIIGSLRAPSLTVEQTGVNFTDVVRQNQSEVLLGQKTFLGGFYALTSLSVTGSVNGVALQQACRRVVRSDVASSFTRLTVRGDVTIHEAGGALVWTVNGLDLSRLDTLLWLQDTPVTLRPPVTLTAPQLASVQAQGLLVGTSPAVSVDLDRYLRHYWSSTRPATLTGDVTFTGDVAVTSLVSDHLTVSGLLNGKQLSTLLTSALTVNGGTVTGLWTLPDLIVTGPVSIATLNGVPVAALARRFVSELHFTAPQTAQHLVVHGEVRLPEGGRVFGLDLSEHFSLSNLLLKDADATVTSQLLIHSLHLTRPVTVSGLVNGVRLQQASLLTLTGMQTIPGVVTIQQVGGDCLSIANLHTPTINAVDLQRLINDAVRRDGSYNISSLWTFTMSPGVDTLMLPGSNESRELSQLLQLQRDALAQLLTVDVATARSYVTVLDTIYRALLDARAQLQVASYLQYYVQTQTWQGAISRLVPLYLERPDVPTLLLAVWERHIRLLRWQPQNGTLPGQFGRWVDGPQYPERGVSWMAGMKRAGGSSHAAVARLADPPPSASVSDRVYTWNDPELMPLQGAVNFIFLYHRGVLVQSQAMPSHKTTDVRAFQPEAGVDCYLFVHFSGNASHLACYQDDSVRFSLHQTIATAGGRQAAVFAAGGLSCAAVASSRWGAGRVDVWCWDSTLQQLRLHQRISTPAVGVAVASFHRHLILAVVEAANFKTDGVVSVYRYEAVLSKFVHVQTLPVPGVVSAQLLVLPSEELVLTCLTTSGHAQYFNYRGWAWFQASGRFATGGASTLEAFNMPGLSTQLAAGGPPRGDMFRLETHYPAAIYSGKFMGHKW